MERQKNIKERNAIILIIAFHLIGLIGIEIPFTRQRFLEFVPYHLLFMTIIVVVMHSGSYKRLLFFMLLIMTVGFGAEWVGVHTGLLFGHYSYGDTLGPKVAGVPLIIGVNWFLLIYCAGVFMQVGRVKKQFPRIIMGAFTLVLLDIVIELSAGRLNYWRWGNDEIQYKNYVCWFILSGLFLFAFEQFRFRRQSIVGEVLLIAQFVFFVVLLV